MYKKIVFLMSKWILNTGLPVKNMKDFYKIECENIATAKLSTFLQNMGGKEGVAWKDYWLFNNKLTCGALYGNRFLLLL